MKILIKNKNQAGNIIQTIIDRKLKLQIQRMC